MSVDKDIDSDLSSLGSSIQSRQLSVTNQRQIYPRSVNSRLSNDTHLHEPGRVSSRTATIVSSIDSLSRANSLAHVLSKSIKEIASQVKDDNRQTDLENAELKSTRLGRERTNFDLADAIRIATYNKTHLGDDEQELELADERDTTSIEQKDEETTEADAYPPRDKGYAWVVAFGQFLLLFSTWGCNGAYGVLLSYWTNNDTFKGATSTDYALVGSLVLCLAQALAPLTQMISAIVGMKETMCFGIACQFSGYLLTSFATKTWQLYLTQGFLVGLGFSFVFNPAIVVLPEWFDKKRGLASGFVVSASGVGGVTFSLASQRLINITGSYKWSLRMIAIIACALNIVLAILVKPRIPKKKLRSWHEIKTRFNILFDWRVVKHLEIHLIALWFTLVVTCYVVALFSLSSYCIFIGLTQTEGSHMTAIFNGCQAVGRIAIGLSADKVGRVNLAICMTIVIIIFIFAMWVNALSYGVVLGYSILSGLTFGVASVLNQPIMADAISPELFPSAWGFENLLVGAFCLWGEVVALKLRDRNSTKPFLKAQLLSGFLAFGGLLFIIPIREWKIRKILETRLAKTEDDLASILAGTNDCAETYKDQDKVEKREIDYELLVGRRGAYKSLLSGGVTGYLKRLFYPIKA